MCHSRWTYTHNNRGEYSIVAINLEQLSSTLFRLVQNVIGGQSSWGLFKIPSWTSIKETKPVQSERPSLKGRLICIVLPSSIVLIVLLFWKKWEKTEDEDQQNSVDEKGLGGLSEDPGHRGLALHVRLLSDLLEQLLQNLGRQKPLLLLLSVRAPFKSGGRSYDWNSRYGEIHIERKTERRKVGKIKGQKDEKTKR